MEEILDLKLFIHPYLKIPFDLPVVNSMHISANLKLIDLMEDTETWFDAEAKKKGVAKELQINVIWNTKEPGKALDPNFRIGDHFASGEKFGIYGDLLDPVEDESIPEDKKIPITIMTGFLGSGKTTLLNYILEEQRERKIAIIENEFGEVSIDDALLKKDKKSMAEKIIVMENGCMCCTLRGDLEKGLLEFVEEIRNGSELDAILIETTGMADPVPIVQTFMQSEELHTHLRLDGTVTLADAKNLGSMLDDTDIQEGKYNIAFQQVAFADKIILNKLDLATAEEAIAIKDRIRDINSFAKILPAVRGRIKLSELSNIHSLNMKRFAEITDFGIEPEQPDLSGHGSSGSGHEDHGGGHGHEDPGGGHGGGHEHEHGGRHGHEHGGGHGESGGHGGGHGDVNGKAHGGGHGGGEVARHDLRINSFSIIREGEITSKKLKRFFQWLALLPPEAGIIYRIKAIFAVQGHPYKHVFHSVMGVADEDDAGPWADDEKKICKIVFIGKSIQQRRFREAFELLFVQPEQTR
jgi:G3E family GTPase